MNICRTHLRKGVYQPTNQFLGGALTIALGGFRCLRLVVWLVNILLMFVVACLVRLDGKVVAWLSPNQVWCDEWWNNEILSWRLRLRRYITLQGLVTVSG